MILVPAKSIQGLLGDLRQPGFTLIEIMIVVSIMGILMAAAIPSFNSFNRTQTLLQAVKSIKSDVRLAQNFSLSGASGKVWGIHFDVGSSSYYLFNCTPGTPSSAPNTTNYRYYVGNPDCAVSKTMALPSIVRTTVTASIDVAFESVNGNIYVNGVVPSGTTDIMVDFISTMTSSTKHVCVTSTGGVREEPTTCT